VTLRIESADIERRFQKARIIRSFRAVVLVIGGFATRGMRYMVELS